MESAVASNVLLNPSFAVLTFLESSGLFAFSAGNVQSPGSREVEFCSVNSAIAGTRLPGFVVASLSHMCPLNIGFLYVLAGILPLHSNS